MITTITARGDVDRLFGEGRRSMTRTISLTAIPTQPARDQSGRVLFVAGKRLGGAIVRNRAKRVLREAVRRSGGPWPGWDVAVMARPATGGATPAELDRDLRRGVEVLGISP